MKKLLIMLLAAVFLGTLAVSIPLPSDEFSPVAYASAKSSKKSKKSPSMNKKKRKQKEEDTEDRLKRLKSMGITKSFAEKRFGTYMSLSDMGKIIADWILDQYNKTGQVSIKTGKNTSDWLVLNVNGECVSSGKVCSRW